MALLVILIEPATDPAAVGANFAVKIVEAPATIVLGAVKPDTLKPDPDTEVAEMVILAEPEFRMVTIVVWLEPTATLPKLIEVGEKSRVPMVGVVASSVTSPVEKTPIAPRRNPVKRTAALATRNGWVFQIFRKKIFRPCEFITHSG